MATLAQPADVRAAAPEFAALTDPELQIYIDMADAEIAEDVWGSRAKLAETLLSCHYATVLRRKGGAVGAVIGTRVGDVSVNYSAPYTRVGSGLDDSLATTPYGLAYTRLINISARGLATTGGC